MTRFDRAEESALLDELIAEASHAHPHRPSIPQLLLRWRVRALLPALYRFADQWDSVERYAVLVAPRSDCHD